MIEQKITTTTGEQIALTVEQAAQSLGISRPTMLELTRKAGFPCFRVGRRILIPRQALIAWADRQATEGAAL